MVLLINYRFCNGVDYLTKNNFFQNIDTNNTDGVKLLTFNKATRKTDDLHYTTLDNKESLISIRYVRHHISPKSLKTLVVRKTYS